MVGVVARSDLLRALLSREREKKPPAAQEDDRTIRTSILAALEAASWAPMTTLNVTVASGRGGCVGHHHQSGRAARDLRDRGERFGGEGGA